MSRARITINGRNYESLEAMPPDVRRLYEDVMRQAGPALADRDGNGIPDIAEGRGRSGPLGGVVVENQIVVNGETYRTIDDMPPDVRTFYQDAMGRVRQGPGLTVTHEGPTFSIGFSRSTERTQLMGVPRSTPRAIEPSAVESSLRRALVLLVVVVIAALGAWALLGR